ncbi:MULTISPECIES: aromatic acid exporter family protein [Kitasatospora]|uniref:aromatic acid exporter family protein n=1 Tax=Kitasatospora TaxID=2063 RepID=UPI000C713446|nr:aromatic acid exporter family protein [Kitasatospora sp. GP30]MDH6143666.1 putative membrane protein YccC [Kitasatospora sp. GP30]
MPLAPSEPLTAATVKQWLRRPVVDQAIRATAAATIAYIVAVHLSSQRAPLTAPLTALLVVQVTVYSTLTTSIRRIAAVVVGVLIAVLFSAVVGLSWWSLALIIVASLMIGHLVRVDEFVSEVAISAMLILGVTQVGSQAWDRVLETLIGAVVGLVFNLVLAPPVWVDTAGESIEDLARRARHLLLEIAEELGRPTPVARAAARLHEARELDQAIAEVDAALRQAEDSLRFNPRIREGLLSRLVLRTGLDTLEICVVVIRVLARSLTDLAKRRGEDEQLLAPELALGMEELLDHLGGALVSFAVMVTDQVGRSAQEAEDRLTSDLAAAWTIRDNLAQQMLRRIQEHPLAWQLHGALLAEADRILDELDLEHRTRRLMEELDRAAVANGTRLERLGFAGRLAERVARTVRGRE